MNHNTYVDYFKAIAANHIDIRHNPKGKTGNFFQLRFSDYPLKVTYLDEFLNDQRTKLNVANMSMILEVFDAQMVSQDDANRFQYITSALYIIGKPKGPGSQHTTDAIDDVYTKAEAICEDIASLLYTDMQNNCDIQLDKSSLMLTKVGPFGEGPFYGAKLYFGYKDNTQYAVYNKDKWINPIETT